MTDKIEENLLKIVAVLNAFPPYSDQLREVVRDIMSASYIQGSNDCHKAIEKGRAK